MQISDHTMAFRKLRMDGPPPFEFAFDGNCGTDWKNWVRSFEIYAAATMMSDPNHKLSWMLHYAGQKVQKVFYSLPEQTENEEKGDVEVKSRGPLAAGYVKFDTDIYDDAIHKLNQFFEPKQNVSYERHIFRQLQQNTNERIDMFLMRLREQAERCNFGDQTDENIRDQITTGCSSDILRRKMLERADKPLPKLIQMAQMIEVVHKQQLSLGKQSTPFNDSSKQIEAHQSDVCKIDAKRQFVPGQKTMNDNFDGLCGRCGFKGHKAMDAKCPAKGKNCNLCGRKDHFARKCFMKNKPMNKANGNRKRPYDGDRSDEPNRKIKPESVQMVESQAANNTTQTIEDEYEDLFCIESKPVSNKVWCTVGGLDVEVIVDSGSRYNVVDRASWIEWKAKNIITIHRQKEVDIQFRSYGGHPLKFLGMVKVIVSVPNAQQAADFYVADEFGKVLLGYETAVALGILKIGTGIESPAAINAVDTTESFTKIKGVMLDIPIKLDVKGVVQPYRRVPAPLEKQVDDKIDEMLRQGIIEKVIGVSKWISQMVIAPKDVDDVRICVDMRRANMAIERENHPLPTLDDFLPQLNDAKIFSKLDVKQAYHQVN